MWQQIINPKSGNKIDIRSKRGKYILNRYIKQLQIGGFTPQPLQIEDLTPEEYEKNRIENRIENIRNLYGLKGGAEPSNNGKINFDEEYMLKLSSMSKEELDKEKSRIDGLNINYSIDEIITELDKAKKASEYVNKNMGFTQIIKNILQEFITHRIKVFKYKLILLSNDNNTIEPSSTITHQHPDVEVKTIYDDFGEVEMVEVGKAKIELDRQMKKNSSTYSKKPLLTIRPQRTNVEVLDYVKGILIDVEKRVLNKMYNYSPTVWKWESKDIDYINEELKCIKFLMRHDQCMSEHGAYFIKTSYEKGLEIIKNKRIRNNFKNKFGDLAYKFASNNKYFNRNESDRLRIENDLLIYKQTSLDLGENKKWERILNAVIPE